MTLASLAQRLRQHHGIEHATMTILTRRLPGASLAARSNLQGFIVYGEVDAIALRAAAEEALARLQHGERGLALHPNCGTNLVAAGMLSGAAALALGGRKGAWWDRLPAAILGATLALLIARPLGRWAQEHITTTPSVAGLRIADVGRLGGGTPVRHRVLIQAGHPSGHSLS